MILSLLCIRAIKIFKPQTTDVIELSQVCILPKYKMSLLWEIKSAATVYEMVENHRNLSIKAKIKI